MPDKGYKKGDIFKYNGTWVEVRSVHKNGTITLVNYYTQKFICRISVEELKEE